MHQFMMKRYLAQPYIEYYRVMKFVNVQAIWSTICRWQLIHNLGNERRILQNTLNEDSSEYMTIQIAPSLAMSLKQHFSAQQRSSTKLTLLRVAQESGRLLKFCRTGKKNRCLTMYENSHAYMRNNFLQHARQQTWMCRWRRGKESSPRRVLRPLNSKLITKFRHGKLNYTRRYLD